MLEPQVEQLLGLIYGRRSEKIDPNQLMFDILMLEVLQREPQAPLQPAAAAPARRESSAKRRHPGRLPMPEHLERVEIVLDVAEEDKRCPETGKSLKLIGWEISKKLEFRPRKVLINVYKRPKYGSPDSIAAGDVGVVVAPMPDHPVEKCKADVGLLAPILVSNFADHLPLYRQDGIFEREEVEIRRATQTSWVLQTYEAILRGHPTAPQPHNARWVDLTITKDGLIGDFKNTGREWRRKGQPICQQRLGPCIDDT